MMKSAKLIISMLAAAAVSSGAAELAPLSKKYLNGAWLGNTTVSVPEAKNIPELDG